MRAALALLALLLAVPRAAPATITFTQLDDSVFSVSHRVKVLGSRAKATRMVFTKAASLCIAAGFSHYRVLHQESEAAQEDDAANATVRVRFFHRDADDRTGCERGADPLYVQEAREKLARLGYRAPPADPGEAAAAAPAATADGGSSAGSCSLEQIAAMARAGLSDEQIRAACLGHPAEAPPGDGS